MYCKTKKIKKIMKKIIDFITFVMAIAFVGSLVLVGKELLTDSSIYLSLLGLIFYCCKFRYFSFFNSTSL